MNQVELQTKPSESGSLQESIVALYRKLLQVKDLDESSSFYQNGGTSLSATLLLAELLSQHGVKLSFDEFQKHDTPAGVAAKLRKPAGGECLPSFERRASHEPRELTLSAAQRSRCWVLDSFRGERAGDEGRYNSGYATWLVGRIDHACLERAFNQVASQHDAFAMAYRTANGRVVQTYEGHKPVDFRVEQAPAGVHEAYRTRSAAADGPRLGDLPEVDAIIHAPFDWASGENLRCRVYTVTEDACLLVLAGNHVAFDFVSRGVFLRALAASYNALIDGQSRSARRPVQYRDYLDWEQRYAESSAYADNLAYWIQYLSGSEQDVAVPVELPRHSARSEDTLYRQDKRYVSLDLALTTRVKETAKAMGVTPYVVLFTAFGMTLASLSRKSRTTIGTQVANRRQQEVLEVCGCFAQPVAIACNLAAQSTVDAVFKSVQSSLNGAIEHQPVSLPAIAEALQREGGKRHHPLYQCSFEYFEAKPQPLALYGVEAHEVLIPYHFARTSSELMFLLWERDEGLSGVLLYAAELYTPARVDAFMASYVSVLGALLDAPQATMRELLPHVYG
jgi:hypothetical protein